MILYFWSGSHGQDNINGQMADDVTDSDSSSYPQSALLNRHFVLFSFQSLRSTILHDLYFHNRCQMHYEPYDNNPYHFIINSSSEINAPLGPRTRRCDIFRFLIGFGAVWSSDFKNFVRTAPHHQVLGPTGSGAWIPVRDGIQVENLTSQKLCPIKISVLFHFGLLYRMTLTLDRLLEIFLAFNCVV